MPTDAQGLYTYASSDPLLPLHDLLNRYAVPTNSKLREILTTLASLASTDSTHNTRLTQLAAELAAEVEARGGDTLSLGNRLDVARRDFELADETLAQRTTRLESKLAPVANLFADPLTWRPQATTEIVNATDAPPWLNTYYRTAPGAGTVSSLGRFVEPGVAFMYFQVWLRADKPNSRIYIELRNQNNEHAVEGQGSYPLAGAVIPTEWTKFTKIFKLVDGTQRIQRGSIYFNHTSGTERTAQVDIAAFEIRPLMPLATTP